MIDYVVSDVHGKPHLLEAILEDSGYKKGEGRFVFAGDFTDIGGSPLEVESMLEELGAEVLVGNHELAHISQLPISPYDKSLDTGGNCRRWAGKVASGEWGLATVVQGHLVTHAGVTNKWLIDQGIGTTDVYKVEEYLNDRLRSAVATEGPYYGIEDHDLFLEDAFAGVGPFWFRPGRHTDDWYFDGIPQIIGHTPLSYFSESEQSRMSQDRVYTADPFARGFDDEKKFAYIVVKDGVATRRVGQLT